MKKCRCEWVEVGNELYEQYHDKEWGVPVYDDRKLFEFLILEGAQAGLSWITILKRRKGYNQAFANFDPKIVSQYDDNKVTELLKDEGIIRHRLKIEATILNAKKFLEVQNEFGSFSQYLWGFVKGKTIQNQRKSIKEVPATSLEAETISKDLRKRGFKFVGPTIIYAYMQAMGLVNDHTVDCFRYSQIQ
jgi:DNA-3-methyladenine glycosylase I